VVRCLEAVFLDNNDKNNCLPRNLSAIALYFFSVMFELDCAWWKLAGLIRNSTSCFAR
jgi:hypothetical protein